MWMCCNCGYIKFTNDLNYVKWAKIQSEIISLLEKSIYLMCDVSISIWISRVTNENDLIV